MSKKYSIRYLSTAEKDINDIFEYIYLDNPSAANNLLDKFDNTISKLASHPFLGIVPNDTRLKRLGYRILIIDNYLVFYVIKVITIQVRRIIHGARKYKFLVK
jgi:addiction module RelE/StbE family toxin